MVANEGGFDDYIPDDFALQGDIPLIDARRTAAIAIDQRGCALDASARNHIQARIVGRADKEQSWLNTSGWDIVPRRTPFPGDGMVTVLKPIPEAEGSVSNADQRSITESPAAAKYGLRRRAGRRRQSVGRWRRDNTGANRQLQRLRPILHRSRHRAGRWHSDWGSSD